MTSPTDSALGSAPGSAREEVLARIRAAHQAAPPGPLAYADVVRDYRPRSGLAEPERVERLVDRLLDYRALVRRTTLAGLPDTIAAALADRGVARLAVPPDLPDSWLSSVTALRATDDAAEPLSVATLDGMDGVLTGCAAAIAETGTLVLDGHTVSGRRVLTLIPDYHLCVVAVDQIEGSVPEALARLDGTRPLTFISGPSATSDIELNRVEGVHGPRTLEVVVVSDGVTPRHDRMSEALRP